MHVEQTGQLRPFLVSTGSSRPCTVHALSFRGCSLHNHVFLDTSQANSSLCPAEWLLRDGTVSDIIVQDKSDPWSFSTSSVNCQWPYITSKLP